MSLWARFRGWAVRFADKWIKGEDLKRKEDEDLAFLAEGQRRAKVSLWRIYHRKKGEGDEDAARVAKRLAERAAKEEIKLTRLVNGQVDLYSYGRVGDD